MTEPETRIVTALKTLVQMYPSLLPAKLELVTDVVDSEELLYQLTLGGESRRGYTAKECLVFLAGVWFALDRSR